MGPSVGMRSSSSFLHASLDQYGTHPFQLASERFFHQRAVSSPSFSISCSANRSASLTDCSSSMTFLARRFSNHASLSFLSKRLVIQLENPFCLSNIFNQSLSPQHVE